MRGFKPSMPTYYEQMPKEADQVPLKIIKKKETRLKKKIVLVDFIGI